MYSQIHIQGGGKVGLRLWICETELILVLLFTDDCIIFHTNRKPACAPPTLHSVCLVVTNSLRKDFHLNVKTWISGQDGDVGKHSSPPCTTTSKLQLQNNHHSELSEIKLNGSLTMELKKLHPSRLVGDTEMRRRGVG